MICIFFCVRAAHRRADELQLRLDDSVAEARRYRQRAKWLTAEVAAFRGRIAGAFLAPHPAPLQIPFPHMILFGNCIFVVLH